MTESFSNAFLRDTKRDSEVGEEAIQNFLHTHPDLNANDIKTAYELALGVDENRLSEELEGRNEANIKELSEILSAAIDTGMPLNRISDFFQHPSGDTKQEVLRLFTEFVYSTSFTNTEKTLLLSIPKRKNGRLYFVMKDTKDEIASIDLKRMAQFPIEKIVKVLTKTITDLQAKYPSNLEILIET